MKKQNRITNDEGLNVAPAGSNAVLAVRLSSAQKREYDILKQYGSCTITDVRRNKIYKKLVEKGLAYQDKKGWNSDCWFGLVK